MRTPVIAANWKMHKDVGEALRFVEDLIPKVQDLDGIDVVVAAPFTALDALKAALAGTPVALGAQNVHPEPKGAFTGEISVPMLVDVGCTYVIVGHSERRALLGETSEFVASKAIAALSGGLRPIVCVGERLEEREAGKTFDVVGAQLDESLRGIERDRAEEVVVAYEPVWAIGTGRTATPEMAQEVHGFIRERLHAPFGDAAARVRIQYGGSVKPDNVYELMAQPDIDGALVGGASLDPASFYAIIRFDRPAQEPGS
jgi:triosephosphate isomerase